MSKKLVKSTLMVSAITLVSRILGFVRDMLIARLFGVDITTDAFFVAFKVPNFLRRLFSEGAVSHALIPVLARYRQNSNLSALQGFLGKTTGTLAVWSALITAIAVITAPLLTIVLAPGFAWQNGQFELAVHLLRIMLPFGFAIVMVALAGSVLNLFEKFAVPAFTPVLLNTCMIVAALWLAPLLEMPITALAWGVLAAGIWQVLFQVPSLVRLGVWPRFKFVYRDKEVNQLSQSLVPALFSASITQINLLLDTLVASFLAPGSVSWLYYSDRLVEFPLGILGMALGTVILPHLSHNHASANSAAFSAILDWGMRLVLLIGLPATIGLVVLAEPMISTLFQYHEFTDQDVHMSGMSLKAYATGLLGYLLIKILVPGFTARQDLQTPVRYGVIAMVISLLLNVVLVFPLAHAGLALATSLGALLNAGLLIYQLKKQKIYEFQSGSLVFLGRIIVASLVMAVVLTYWIDGNWQYAWQAQLRIINLLKGIGIGCLSYALTLLITGLKWRHFSLVNDKI